jgi:hypothetical protein
VGMMPKEKAQDLFYKYLLYFPEFYNDLEYDYNSEDAKQCALIAVNEILNVIHTNMEDRYWQEVKKEIENL